MSLIPKIFLSTTAVAVVGLGLSGYAVREARAALTDIAPVPVINRQSVGAKPNLMFVLDDSGSMARSFMPDEMGELDSYGYRSAQCNGVAFDPLLVYPPPVDSTGTRFPAANFSSALVDGYDSGSRRVNLANSSYYVYDGTEKRMGWTYNSLGKVDTGSTFYRECLSLVGTNPGRSRFTLESLTSASPLAQSYANWYSYYRTRSLLMRTSVGQAVAGLSVDYRVGFSRINHAGVTDSADFRDTKDFDAAHKLKFYNSLYSAGPGGGTPLRGALSKVGRYFANKGSGQTYDPMAYSCQRNYALLSTDGYWNSGGSPGQAENASYGPYDLSGNLVGNQDAAEVRPMYDGGSSVKTETTPSSTVTRWQVVTTNNAVTTFRRDSVVITTSAACKNNEVRQSVTPQSRTVTNSTATTSVERETSTTTRTIVTTDGATPVETISQPVLTTAVESSGSPQPLPQTSTGYVNGTTITSCVRSNRALPAGFSAETSTTSNSSSQTRSSLGTPVTTVGETRTDIRSSGGSSNTLSDVAQYYYANDLRAPIHGNCTSTSSGQARDVCTNNVPNVGRQFMTTFTLGLGTGGTLAFDKNYLQQTTSGDYAALSGNATPVKNWPQTTTVIHGGSGDARNIDDLWHAAVNGRGKYYSAADAGELSSAIADVIDSINEAEGAGSASSFNSLSLVPGSANQILQASYMSFSWTGDVKAFSVDGQSGTVNGTALWSAQAKLDVMPWNNRRILYRQSQASPTLRQFTFGNLSADGHGAYFANFCAQASVASQCAALSTSDPDLRAAADNGVNLVNYLAGDTSNTTSNSASPLFRSRKHILGDIIGSAPVYVGKPPFNYTDAGYANHKSKQVTREPMVYAGANDGMLHAFSARTGIEKWAYVPTAVMPKMYRLADNGYGSNHQSFVDGEPLVADIFDGSNWKTILIGGLRNGGKAYFALDITDPDNPKSLWEFSDRNLGLSFGTPIVTKRVDGTWVVALTSGYNNSGGDGKGHLYVLNANTGKLLHDLVTSAGSPDSPSGLGPLNAWVDLSTNNTAKRFYAGDMLGNLWRFDIDGLTLPKESAFLLAQMKTSDGQPQPITAKPAMVLVSGKYPIVVVGTGRYLGDSDIRDKTQQSIYIVKDPLNDAGLGILRSNPKFVRHTLKVTGDSANSSTEPIDWSLNAGWWFDLPNDGERVISSMTLLSGLLYVPTAVPNVDACSVGGASWLYRINITTGLSPEPIGSLFSANSLIVGLTGVKQSDGTTTLFVRDSSGGTKTVKGLPPGKPLPGPVRRTSWRELIN